MTTRIKLLGDGEFVDTDRYSYTEVVRAKTDGIPLALGGPSEFGFPDGADPADADLTQWPALRTIYPQAIASVEEVGA